MKNKFIKALASLACLTLIAAMSLSLASCGSITAPVTDVSSVIASVDSEAVSSDADSAAVDSTESETAAVKFTFKATLSDGTEKTQEIETEKENVGDALVEAGLISGSDSEYGLMVDTVCGEKHDFNEDGTYWAFYIDGEYAMTGVSSTPVTAGSTYEFKVES